jgi:betaine-aldehyde dehydrogenase
MPTLPTLTDEFYLGGKWIPAADPANRYQVISPVSEAVIADVAYPTIAEADAAVAAARRAFDYGPWPTMSVAERAGYLRRLCDEFEKRMDDFNAAWTAESGPPASHAARLGGNVVMLWRDLLRRADDLQVQERRSYPGAEVDVVREPVGVAVIITAWNAPALYVALKLAPALLAGCTVIWKMAQESQLTARVLAEIADVAGFPEGVLTVLAASSDVSASLVGNPDVDKVSLTGGVPAGRAIMAACAPRVANVTLELGGKSPAIVADDIALERVLPTLIPGFVTFQGQVCIALTRLLVSAERHDELVDAVVTRLSALKIGDPADPSTDLGPLGTRRQLGRVEEYVASGRSQGAHVAVGGRRPEGMDTGFFYEPTVFTDVTPDMRIAQEEIFGPVLSVIRYRDLDDAISIANGTAYGLAATIYTDDEELATATARRIRSGTVAHNGAGPSLFAPFGGYCQSGLGREGGLEGVGEFLQYKSIRRAPVA